MRMHSNGPSIGHSMLCYLLYYTIVLQLSERKKNLKQVIACYITYIIINLFRRKKEKSKIELTSLFGNRRSTIICWVERRLRKR